MSAASFFHSSFDHPRTMGGSRVTGKRDTASFTRPHGAVRFNAGDLRAICIAFASTAGFILGVALICDAYLIAVSMASPRGFDTFAMQQLARDLLPWAVAFTAFAGLAVVIGLKLAQRCSSTTEQGQLGFGRV